VGSCVPVENSTTGVNGQAGAQNSNTNGNGQVVDNHLNIVINDQEVPQQEKKIE
jgi:hypothetical protein